MQRLSNELNLAESDEDRLRIAWDRLLSTIGGPPTEKRPQDSEANTAHLSKIPVTILTGFLGSGKTTLLCNILEEEPGNVLAIVNDMATVNIDAELIRTRSANTIQLENGCACCVLGDNLDELLTEAGLGDKAPDHIILEASGISDPVSLAQTVSNNDATVLDGIVALVDARNLASLKSNPAIAPLLMRQLDASHIVALSKTETDDDLDGWQSGIGKLAPGRPVIFLNDCDDLSGTLLGSGTRGARPEPEQRTHDFSRFTSSVIQSTGPICGDALFEQLNDIPACIYRIKGWLTIEDDAKTQRYLLQVAGPRWRLETAQTSGIDQLVVIGDSTDELYEVFCRNLSSLISQTS